MVGMRGDGDGGDGNGGGFRSLSVGIRKML